MWFYRDSKRSPAAAPKLVLPKPAATGPQADLRPAVRAILAGRAKDPDPWLLMALLVDSRVEMDDGSKLDGLSWLDAERLLAEANTDANGTAEPLRLYNRFSREFGDGYTLKSDLPETHTTALREILAALKASPGVKSVDPREMRKSMIWEPSAQPVDTGAPESES